MALINKTVHTLPKRLVMITVIAVVLGDIVAPWLRSQVTVAQLAKVDSYSLGGVGMVGAIPEREDEFFVLLSSPYAARLFRDLYEQGTTPEAKLYALAGLHVTDRNRFRECAARFVKESSRVRTQHGCIVSGSTTVEAVAALENDQVEDYLEFKKEYGRPPRTLVDR